MKPNGIELDELAVALKIKYILFLFQISLGPRDKYINKNSERSDECIDFTMMCVFFCVSVYSITSRNNAPISNFGGGFR
ncbi:Uncharacterized protein FWK35_00004590 [Aphis craccivora]|uniref:Uncharacterized protein n=2 Tax=Aphis craccivora TaxID=307492 RepID=A0A6G0ZKP0_APHCR|nr:Uncharacterized protein FWK35_00004590 [Aphis craccivora]